MPIELTKVRWSMLLVTTPFIAALLYLAVRNAGSAELVASDSRIVSFKVYFDERVRFPENIRQSTIKMLFGPGYAIVDADRAADVSRAHQPAEKERDCDCRVTHQGGLLALRVPQHAVTADIAAKLSRLSRIKTIVIHMNE